MIYDLRNGPSPITRGLAAVSAWMLIIVIIRDLAYLYVYKLRG